MRICNIKGDPRTIQTKILVSHRKGENLLVDARQINNPKGKANRRVRKNSFPDTHSPSKRDNVTLQKEVSVEKANNISTP